MIVARAASELRAELAPQCSAGHRIGLVATMGALHEGHLSLVRAAKAACEVVVMSIFVNPLQFGPHEDLASYPRDEAGDLAIAKGNGVDLVFCPSVEEMYPEGSSTTVTVGPIGEVLEGAARPGHFAGVATVVTKLFNIVRPDAAFFGQKDAQQLAVIRRMTADLAFPIEIVACPTVRDPDGVALSSRNRHLSAEDRSRATALRRSLRAGKAALRATHSPEAAEKQMWEVLISEEGLEPDYAAAVDPFTFRPARWGKPILLAVAARVGSTRLIDNHPIEPLDKEGRR